MRKNSEVTQFCDLKSFLFLDEDSVMIPNGL